MKITTSDSKINPFGGFNFCIDLLEKEGIPRLIDQHLGKRVQLFGFDYSQILMNQLALYFTGGDCAEDINEHLKPHLEKVKGMSVCSADTLLRGVKELSTPDLNFTSPRGVNHAFNVNLRLNRLLVKALKHTGQVNDQQGYTLDYDNQIIATEKYDAKRTYKSGEGYQPGVASIGEHIVYIEGRNGNSQAKYKQEQTLNRAFSVLEEQQVSIKRFRADLASYQKKVVDEVSQRCELFYIRAMRSADMEQQIGEIKDEEWKKIRLGVMEM